MRGHAGAGAQNVNVKLLDAKGKCVFEEFGELLFTHFGLSGPVILSASCHMQRGKDGYRVAMDLKPALDERRWMQGFCAILRSFRTRIWRTRS